MQLEYRTPATSINAYAMLSPHPDNPKFYYVDKVYVQPSARGVGLARLLMAMVLADADREGVTLCVLVMRGGGKGAMSDNHLRAWYKRLGFGERLDHTMRRSPQPPPPPLGAPFDELLP